MTCQTNTRLTPACRCHFRVGLTSLVTLLLASQLLSSPLKADYQTGLDAYNAAQYKKALSEWLAVVEAPPEETNPAVFGETHYAIAMLYWMGQGVPQSYEKAYNWLLSAVKLGHAGAQAKLGYMYSEGVVVEHDYTQAFKWFQLAAKQGSIDGQYNLGICYLNGWGTEPNATMAAQYLAAASAQGDEAAEEALQIVLANYMLRRPEPESSEPGTGILNNEPWILEQNPNDYTIQVIGLSNRTRLESLIDGYDQLSPLAIYEVQRKSKPIFILLQGVYPDVETARAAKARFPKAIQETEALWIRQYRNVQQLIKNEAENADE